MIKAIVSDFSRVILFPVDNNYAGGLNNLHKELSAHRGYDFWEHFRLNQDLFNFYETLSGKIDVYMFTTEHIQEHPALQSKIEGVFKNVFSGARLGLKKNETQSYKTIIKEIGLNPEEILYIDDKQENLDAAKEAGMAILHYQSNDQTIEEIKKIMN